MILGIDLGTTKSVVGAWDNNKPYIIPHSNGKLSTPSKVLITQEGEIFAGNHAEQHGDRYNEAVKTITVSSVKRLMGKRGETGWGWWKTYPQEVSAFILSELKYQAEQKFNQKIEDAVIAIPSHFDEGQRRATKEAAEIAGLKVHRLLNEATAAILTYGYQRNPTGKVMVCDFGGGTLDVSIVDVSDQFYEVLAVEGESKLGGDDFDQVIVDYILDKYKNECNVEISLTQTQSLLLKEVAERAKIELSNSNETHIYIPGFFNHSNQMLAIDVTIDRNTFVQLSNSLLDRVINLIKKALNSARIVASDITSLLLIGGSSRIPYIREQIISDLKINPFVGVNIETCVAEGAIILAGILEGSTSLRNLLILDVIPSTYGVRGLGEVFNPMISKNCTVPCSKKEVFTTVEDNQTEIDIMVYQGEREFVKDNVFLGKMKLKNIPPAPRGVPQIEVTFEIDANMIVKVSAKDLGTNNATEIEVNSPYGLNQIQLDVMKKKMSSWLFDRKHKYSVRSLITTVEQTISNDNSCLKWDEINELKEKIYLLKTYEKQRVSEEEIEEICFLTKSLHEKALKKIESHNKIIESAELINNQINKSFSSLNSYDIQKAELLMAGKSLLEDYILRSTAIGEIQKLLTSITKTYEDTKVGCLLDRLYILKSEKQIDDWISHSSNFEFRTSEIVSKVSMLMENKDVKDFICLVEEDNCRFREPILNRLLNSNKENAELYPLLLLIISSSIEHSIIKNINLDLITEKNNGYKIILLALFYGLRKDISPEKRRMTAELIACILPQYEYLDQIIDYVCEEDDSNVQVTLISYVNSHPAGTLQDIYSRADAILKNKINECKELLFILAKEPSVEIRLRVVEIFETLQFEEISDSLICLTKDSDHVVREKAIRIILEKCVVIPKQSLEIANEYLFDPFEKNRLLVLEFLENNIDMTLLPILQKLYQQENVDLVKEKTISLLGSLPDQSNIPILFSILLDKNLHLRKSALSSIHKHKQLMSKNEKKLIKVFHSTILNKKKLSLRNSFFLRKLTFENNEMNNVVDYIKNYDLNSKKELN